MPARSVHTLFVAATLLVAPPTAGAQPETRGASQSFAVIEFGAARVACIQADAEVVNGKLQFDVRDIATTEPKGGFFEEGMLKEDALLAATGSAAELYGKLLRGQPLHGADKKADREKVKPESIWFIADNHFSARSPAEKDKIVDMLNRALDAKGQGIAGWKEWKDAQPGKTIAVTFLEPRQEAQYRAYEMERIDDKTGEYTFIDVAAGVTTIGYKVPRNGDSLPQLLTERERIPGSLEAKLKIRESVGKDQYQQEFTKHLPGVLKKDITAPFVYNRDVRVGFVNFDRHYIVGDMASALPILVSPEKLLQAPKEIAITAEDITRFEKLVQTRRDKDGRLEFPPLVLPEGVNSQTEIRLQEEYKYLKRTYSAEQLAAAAGILKEWSTTFRMDGANKTIYILRSDGRRRNEESSQYVRNSQYLLATGFLRYQLQQSLTRSLRKD